MSEDSKAYRKASWNAQWTETFALKVRADSALNVACRPEGLNGMRFLLPPFAMSNSPMQGLVNGTLLRPHSCRAAAL